MKKYHRIFPFVYLYDGVLKHCNECKNVLRKSQFDYLTKKKRIAKIGGLLCSKCGRKFINVITYNNVTNNGKHNVIVLASDEVIHGNEIEKNAKLIKPHKLEVNKESNDSKKDCKLISPTSSLIPANGDVVVFRSINNKCKLQHIECVRQIPLKFIQIGSGLSKEMLGFYCTKCKMKFINYSAISDYRELKYIPDFQCKLSYEFGDDLNEVSMLGLYGYNVQKGDLSESQRHSIIDYVIKKKLLSPLEVIHILEFNIKFKKKIPSLQDAVRKWDDDIKYVNSIK